MVGVDLGIAFCFGVYIGFGIGAIAYASTILCIRDTKR